MFDNKKPTAQMLGRFQPWHGGHRRLFLESLNKTGQVIIMVRDMPISTKNPFCFEEVKKRIEEDLVDYKDCFKIISVPNITTICYGRDVGYSLEYIDLPKDIQDISATKIRKEMGYV